MNKPTLPNKPVKPVTVTNQENINPSVEAKEDVYVLLVKELQKQNAELQQQNQKFMETLVDKIKPNNKSVKSSTSTAEIMSEQLANEKIEQKMYSYETLNSIPAAMRKTYMEHLKEGRHRGLYLGNMVDRAEIFIPRRMNNGTPEVIFPFVLVRPFGGRMITYTWSEFNKPIAVLGIHAQEIQDYINNYNMDNPNEVTYYDPTGTNVRVN